MKWDEEIKKAEECRLNDRSVMDIMGAKEFQNRGAAGPETSTSPKNFEDGKDIEWIRLGLDIEEKQ
jgi:hypothetical protein